MLGDWLVEDWFFIKSFWKMREGFWKGATGPHFSILKHQINENEHQCKLFLNYFPSFLIQFLNIIKGSNGWKPKGLNSSFKVNYLKLLIPQNWLSPRRLIETMNDFFEKIKLFFSTGADFTVFIQSDGTIQSNLMGIYQLENIVFSMTCLSKRVCDTVTDTLCLNNCIKVGSKMTVSGRI